MDPDTPPMRPPPPPPPLTKKQQRPKITLQIPDASSPVPVRPATSPTIYWGPPKYYGKSPVPMTPASRISDPHSNPYFGPFAHMYQNKASEFMFKQFEGFKDFTMNTAKSGLSAGEKSAFWFYNRLRILSKKWFTHLFLTLCLVLYSVMGAAIFMTLEETCGRHENYDDLSTNPSTNSHWSSVVEQPPGYLNNGERPVLNSPHTGFTGPHEEQYHKNLNDVRKDIAKKLDKIVRNDTIMKSNPDFFQLIENDLIAYEESYLECLKYVNNNDTTWTFWNSMFFAGTIYTTIVELAGSILRHAAPLRVGRGVSGRPSNRSSTKKPSEKT